MNSTIENNFKYHAPTAGQPEKYEKLRAKAKDFAYLIDELCPNSREKSKAMTELEDCVMWANASVARNPIPVPPVAEGWKPGLAEFRKDFNQPLPVEKTC